ncbi:MAG: hypothetical protein J5562_06880 [Clostridia bacterium]|nr:hypothetical protein [Clostridia bacterium]
MNKYFRTAVSVLLCLSLVFGLAATGFTAGAKRSSCGDDCEFYPTIIVPGLGQSPVWVTDENGEPITDGDGNRVTAFPAYLQLGKIIGTVLFPALLSILTQRDIGLSDAFAKAIDDSFGINTSDLTAHNTGNVVTQKFLHSYAECDESEIALINMHIPFEKYTTELPKDHIYYYTYNSFGNHIDLAADLHDYIDMVKEQTGHDKVNLVPLSQGASIVSAMLEYYPDTYKELHKVMFVVPALDGSIIIGDVFNGRVNFLNKDYLYNGFLEEMTLLDEYTARLIEVAARILPDEVLMATLEKGVKHLVENTMIRSTSMWALCPSGDYPTAAEKYLSSPEMADIKAQTDRYYQAQLHARDNIQKLVDNGVQVFDVVEYNIPVINVSERWNTMNGDFIIQVDSTSMGAYTANVGETLPDGYQQKNTHCTNPGHNHISPDNVVDASAGLLPDTTFYFNGQRHDLTQHNDVILRLAMRLIADDEITDVYSSPEFPQFLSGRNVSTLNSLLETAQGVDRSKLSAEKARALDAAVEKSNAVLSDNLTTKEDIADCEKALTDALVDAGAMKAQSEKDPSTLRRVSLYLYDNFGTNGYSEIPLLAIAKLFALLKSAIS